MADEIAITFFLYFNKRCAKLWFLLYRGYSFFLYGSFKWHQYHTVNIGCNSNFSVICDTVVSLIHNSHFFISQHNIKIFKHFKEPSEIHVLGLLVRSVNAHFKCTFSQTAIQPTSLIKVKCRPVNWIKRSDLILIDIAVKLQTTLPLSDFLGHLRASTHYR